MKKHCSINPLQNKTVLLIEHLKQLIEFGIEFVFPTQCVACKIYKQGVICHECRTSLENIRPESFMSRKPSEDWEIEDTLKSRTYLEKVYYFYYYNNVIHSLIAEIKYAGRTKLIKYVIDLILQSREFHKINFTDIQFITFVPLHKDKAAIRGFNQSELLAQELSRILNIPCIQILEKHKSTKNQADLDRKERLTNLENAFSINSNLTKNLDTNKILIVDDICSTGTTLNECAKTIKKFYPNTKIYGLCLARGKPNS
ncbi:MAG: phosphoribosyltransferase [Candidatus Dojkabacteria bacterium]|nr:MAG: phosphoribosyltransferase [Candidatus Dojkabacteria bacterium]